MASYRINICLFSKQTHFELLMGYNLSYLCDNVVLYLSISNQTRWLLNLTNTLRLDLTNDCNKDVYPTSLHLQVEFNVNVWIQRVENFGKVRCKTIRKRCYFLFTYSNSKSNRMVYLVYYCCIPGLSTPYKLFGFRMDIIFVLLKKLWLWIG